MSGVRRINIFKPYKRYKELLKKYNTLKNDYEILLELSKNDMFNSVMKNLNQEIANKKLKTENKHLREKVKTLREILLKNTEKVQVERI